jgi:hypothetical protein
MRAWAAVADEMTARLFPQLPSADALRQPWLEVVG